MPLKRKNFHETVVVGGESTMKVLRDRTLQTPPKEFQKNKRHH